MRKKLLLKILSLKLYSYQNKILVLRNFMNLLSSSFTSMQYFLNKLLVRKKINHRRILLLLSKNNPENISTSVQSCFSVNMMSWRRTTSNQRWNNVLYVNVEISKVQQRWNPIVYFNVELNNARQRRNNVANMIISKKKNKPRFQKQNNIFELQGRCWTQSFLLFFPILRAICKRILVEPQKFLKHRIHWITKSIFKPSHLKC